MSLSSYIGFGDTAGLPLARLFAQRPMSQRRTNSIVRRTYQEVGEKLSDFGKEVLGNVGKKAPTKLYDQNAHYRKLSDKLGSNSNPALKELVNRAGNGNNQFNKQFLKKATAAVPKAIIEGQGQPEPVPGYTADSIATAAFSAFAPPPLTPEEAAAAAAAEKRAANKAAGLAKAAATRAAKREAEAAKVATALEALRQIESLTADQKREIKRLERLQTRAEKAAAKAASPEPAAAAPAAAEDATVEETAAASRAKEDAAEAARAAALADETDGLVGEEKDVAAAVEASSEADNNDPDMMLIVAKELSFLKDAEVSINPKAKKVDIVAASREDAMAILQALSNKIVSLKHHPKYKGMLMEFSSRVSYRRGTPAAAVGGGGSEAAAAAPTPASAAVKAAVAADKKAKK